MKVSIPDKGNSRRQGWQNWKPQEKSQGGWAPGERQVGVGASPPGSWVVE